MSINLLAGALKHTASFALNCVRSNKEQRASAKALCKTSVNRSGKRVFTGDKRRLRQSQTLDV